MNDDLISYDKIISEEYSSTYSITILQHYQVFIFETPDHRCSEGHLDTLQQEAGASWGDMLPWIPRTKGYPR